MYIVTGGAGMIGSAAVWALNRKGVEDILIVDNLASGEKWKNLVCLRYADYMHRDEFLQKIKAIPALCENRPSQLPASGKILPAPVST